MSPILPRGAPVVKALDTRAGFFYDAGMTLEEFGNWYRKRYRRTSSALTATALIAADMFAVMVSFGTGFFLVNTYDMSAINFSSFVTYWPYIPLFIVFFVFMLLYPGISLAPAEELRRFTFASLLAHGGIIVSRYIDDREFDSISVAFLLSFILSPVILMICRDMMHRFLRKTGLAGIPAVIYGSGTLARVVADRLIDSGKAGYVPAVMLDEAGGGGGEYRGVPILRDTALGPELVRRFHIRMAIVAIPGLPREEMARLFNGSLTAFRYNVLIPDFLDATSVWITVRDFDGVLGLATTHRLRMPWNLVIKRVMDVAAVTVGGLILLPLLLLIALVIKLTSPGPVLYGHERLGLNGKPFRAWKFRSMTPGADRKLEALLEADPRLREEWEASHKLKNDPRVTGIGKILRRTSFDEFPQLLNILAGEMSLVGPRPVTADEVGKYGEGFTRIFSVKPGLTGLWQVSGRSDADYADRIAYDTYYLQSWSIWLDLWVLFKTPGVILRGKGAY